MLTLSLNRVNIPLPLDFTCRLTWKSPVCSFDNIPSGYALGLTFSINEYTRAIFGNPEQFAKYRSSTSSGTDQKFPGFEIRFSGILLMTGTLTITGASKGNYEASLIDQLGVLGEKEQERDILEIPEFAQGIEWVDTNNFNPDEHTFCCFPIRNNGFFKDKGMKVTRQLPPPGDGSSQGTYDVEVLTFLFVRTFGTVNERGIDGTIDRSPSDIELNAYTQSAGTVTVVSPFFFLNKVIELAIKDSGFYLATNFLNDDISLKNICIYNNYDLTKTEFITGELKYVQGMPSVTYKVSGGYIVEDNWNWVFIGGGNKIVKYIRSYTDLIVPKNHLPKMKTGDLVLSTQNIFNVAFHFLPDNTVNVFSREELLTGESIDLDKYFVGEWVIGEKKKVALKFTREHDTNDLVFSERWHDLSDRRTDIKASVDVMEDLQELFNPLEGEIRFVRTLNAFYEYRILTEEEVDPVTKGSTHTDILGWEEISIGLQNGWYEYGREEVEEIKSSWSTCFERDNYAQADQPGIMNMMKDKNQSFSPRLLIRDHWSTNAGSTSTEEFSFEYEDAETGLFENFWKYWNRFWANRLPVSGEFDLPVNVLRHMIYNICQKYRTREGEFLIDEMSCDLYLDRIGTTEIKGFKVD